MHSWTTIDSLSASQRGVTIERDGVVLRFDAAGRLTTVYDGTHVYRRGLDGTVVRMKWAQHTIDGESTRIREVESVLPARRETLVAEAYRNATRTLQDVFEDPDRSLEPEARRSIRRVIESSPESLEAEANRFDSIYEPLGVLPPDQYGAVVLQSVTGCPHDCSFCTLYRDADVSVRSVDAFESHVDEVTSFLDRGLQSRRGVFVGSANPLSDPEQFAAALGVIQREFPDQFAHGVQAFGNLRTIASLPQETLKGLAAFGLDRVAVGAESGSPEILELLRKPQTPGEIRAGIERLKSAGIDVSVILLAGVGGVELADAHLSRTADLVASLPLAAADIVYVSPLVGTQTADYAAQLADRSLSPLSEDAIARQAQTLRADLASRTPARVARYSVAESVYV